MASDLTSPEDGDTRMDGKGRLKRLPARVASAAMIALVLALALPQAACVTAYRQSIGDDTNRAFTRIYLTDFNTAWQAVLDSMKSARLDVSNREGGYIQTRWTENTAEKNFVDSFGASDAYLKAQFRLRVNVSKGFYNGSPSIKVTVQKEQLIQRDVLEGWRPVETDEIEEKTILYRIGRLIWMRMRLAQIEEEKTKKAMEDLSF